MQSPNRWRISRLNKQIPKIALAAAMFIFNIADLSAETVADKPDIAVLPFEIHDGSGERTSQAEQDRMLAEITEFTRRELEQAGIYDVISGPKVDDAVRRVDSGTYLRSCNGCEFDIARIVNADQVMIPWIYKVSSLVLSLRVQIKDVETEKPIYARSLDFRGDNMKAWQRSVKYMVRSLTEQQNKASKVR